MQRRDCSVVGLRSRLLGDGFLLRQRIRQQDRLGPALQSERLTAAHRTLPFGTKLRVSHGGRSVVVTINDRGPFVRGRVLDLSTAAARVVGLTGAGVGRVTAESSDLKAFQRLFL